MKQIIVMMALALSCVASFGRSKDTVKKYTNDDDKVVVKHCEMESFDDMSDECYLMWVDGEGYKLALRLKKETVTGSKSIDIKLQDGTVLKTKATAEDAEKVYNPWIGWVYTTDMVITLDDEMLNAMLEGKVVGFDLYTKGRGEEPYQWEKKKKWDFDKNFVHMYEHINKEK